MRVEEEKSEGGREGRGPRSRSADHSAERAKIVGLANLHPPLIKSS